jgi:MATE family multidrug resistance protein
LLEYSLPLASDISIGHLSTTDLAASALANMTAAVTGYSILQGFISSRESSFRSWLIACLAFFETWR